MDCIFCKIVKNELPAHKIYEDDYMVAFLDNSPVNEGHVLIVPRRHWKSLDEVDDLMAGYLMIVVRKIGAAIKKTLGASGYNVVINNGSVAGQIIDHFHCHVIPRFDGDGLHSWPQKQYESGKADRLAASLKANLS